MLHDDSNQKYWDHTLNDVTQQDWPPQQISVGQHCQLQAHNMAPPFTPGFTPLGQIISRDNNTLSIQHSVPMTQASSTRNTKDILPRHTVYHGPSKKTAFPFPPTAPTPLPTHQVPNKQSQNLIRGATPKTQATPSLTRATSVTSQNEPPEQKSTSSVGVKRRLGMGQGTVGYTNKKFKPPT